MQTLTPFEMQQVMGGECARHIHPSWWVAATTPGFIVGALVFSVTAFSPNPISLLTALTVGGAVAMGVAAGFDVLENWEYRYYYGN